MAKRQAAKAAEAAPADDWGSGSGAPGPDVTGTESAEERGEELAEADEAASREAAEGDALDDAEDGEHDAGDAPDEDPAADLAAVGTRVYDDEDAGTAGMIGDEVTGDGAGNGIMPALTPRQRAGLDPVDKARHLREATDRTDLTNGQTEHERENGLDTVSGTPNPGVTRNVAHSTPGVGGQNDMSGRPALPDPLASAGPQVRAAVGKLAAASQKAIAERKRGQGYLTLAELGVNKAVADALVDGGHATVETRPGAHFMPDTGVVYRLASHVDPE